jgi:hypothetical protein
VGEWWGGWVEILAKAIPRGTRLVMLDDMSLLNAAKASKGSEKK